jgi:hypothetical protein
MIFALFGNFKGGRSTIAENVVRSTGVIAIQNLLRYIALISLLISILSN